MAVKIAINGFGRVGRAAFRAASERDGDLEWVAINDLADGAALAHLLQHDSVYGRFAENVDASEGVICVGDDRIPFFSESDPAELPWQELEVDVVLECTGRFRSRGDAAAHLETGARKVIVSAPMKDADATVVLGVNFEEAYDPESHDVVSNASCTTNCLAPVAKVLHETVGILADGLMTTIHAYTADQRLIDLPHKDFRRARAAAINLDPDLDRSSESDRARDPGAGRQAERLRGPGTDPDRFDRRPDDRGGASHLGRGNQRRVPGAS